MRNIGLGLHINLGALHRDINHTSNAVEQPVTNLLASQGVIENAALTGGAQIVDNELSKTGITEAVAEFIVPPLVTGVYELQAETVGRTAGSWKPTIENIDPIPNLPIVSNVISTVTFNVTDTPSRLRFILNPLFNGRILLLSAILRRL